MVSFQKAILQVFILVSFLFCAHWACSASASSSSEPEFPELVKVYPEVPAFDGDLFVVFAHADDELLSLGYVAKLRRLYPKKPIHWILVSDSGKGWVVPFTCIGKSTVACRSAEAQDAASCVGIEAPVEMKLHDGSLKNYKDIDKKILETIKKLTVEKVGAVLTSDNTGIYGHPDHLVVHDSIVRLAKESNWTVITNAVPKKFREKIKLRKSAKDRKDVPITYIVDLDEEIKTKLVCAFKAHRSQSLVLWMMDQMHSPRGFLDKIPRQFFNVSP